MVERNGMERSGSTMKAEAETETGTEAGEDTAIRLRREII